MSANPAVVGPEIVSRRRFAAISYLRAFVTLLVLGHHAALAYHPFGPPAPPSSLLAQPRWWPAFPILDSQRWTGFAAFVGFNDIFFMALMFFLSGGRLRTTSDSFLRDSGRALGRRVCPIGGDLQ